VDDHAISFHFRLETHLTCSRYTFDPPISRTVRLFQFQWLSFYFCCQSVLVPIKSNICVSNQIVNEITQNGEKVEVYLQLHWGSGLHFSRHAFMVTCVWIQFAVVPYTYVSVIWLRLVADLSLLGYRRRILRVASTPGRHISDDGVAPP